MQGGSICAAARPAGSSGRMGIMWWTDTVHIKKNSPTDREAGAGAVSGHGIGEASQPPICCQPQRKPLIPLAKLRPLCHPWASLLLLLVVLEAGPAGGSPRRAAGCLPWAGTGRTCRPSPSPRCGS